MTWRRAGWARAGVALLLSALIVTLAPPVPLLILLPVLALSVVGAWGHVAAAAAGSALVTFWIVDAGAPPTPAWPVAVTVLAGGLGVTLVTWLRQRYRPGSGSRHVDHVWLQTAQAGEQLRDKPRLVVTQGATVVLWLPYPGGARLVTVTAPGRTDDLVRQLQPLTPALQESIPLQVAAEAVQKSCLRAEDGGLLLDIGVLRQVAFVAVRGGSAVLAAGDRLDLLDNPGPHDGSGPPAVRRHRLPTDDRLVVLAGAGSLSPTWAQAAPAVSGLAAAAAERLRAFAAEVQAPHDAVVLFGLTAASTGRSGRRRS